MTLTNARAMSELGIEMIFAGTPQAKGRVERSFNTHQDRLVKELRLANISDMATANEFLAREYIPKHNAKFAVAPAKDINAHRAILATHKLDEILSMQTERTLTNDFTLRFKNRFFQLLAEQTIRIRAKDSIIVQIRLDGTIHLKFKDVYLNYKLLPKRPYKPFYLSNKQLLKDYSKSSKTYIPPNNHPWRSFSLSSNKQPNTGCTTAKIS